MTLIRSKYSFQSRQRFLKREVAFAVNVENDCIVISSETASKRLLENLKDEIVHDGYVENGEVEHGKLLLFNPDLWDCSTEELKEIITAKLEDENYEVTFLS